MITTGQKLIVLVTPLAAIAAAHQLANMSSPSKRPHRTWLEVRHPERFGKGRVETAPAETPVDGTAATAEPTGDAARKPAEKPGSGTTPPATGKTPDKGEKTPEKPAPPATAGGTSAPAAVDYPVPSGLRLPVCASSSPLTHPAAKRLDLQIGSKNSFTFKGAWADEAKVAAALAAESKGHLFYIAADDGSTWDTVVATASVAVKAGWTDIGLVVVLESARGKGRVLRLAAAPAEEPEEPSVVQVISGVSGVSYILGGDKVKDLAELDKRVKQVHEDYAAMISAEYADSVDTTAWIVDGSGATTGAVVQVMDAMAKAGIKAVRLKGLSR